MPAENDERNLLNNGAEEVYSNVRWSGTHQNLSDSLERLQIEGPHAVKGIPALPSVFAIFSPLLSITCVFGEVFGKASFWGPNRLGSLPVGKFPSPPLLPRSSFHDRSFGYSRH